MYCIYVYKVVGQKKCQNKVFSNLIINYYKKLMNQNVRNLAFPQLYPGELQTTCKCKKFEKSLKLTHPILYTLHKTLYSLEIVHHAADRGLSFFFLLSRVNVPGIKDKGRSLIILYELYILLSGCN